MSCLPREKPRRCQALCREKQSCRLPASKVFPVLPVRKPVSEGWDSEPRAPGTARGHPWLSLPGMLLSWEQLLAQDVRVRATRQPRALSPSKPAGCGGARTPRGADGFLHVPGTAPRRHSRQAQLQPRSTFTALLVCVAWKATLRCQQQHGQQAKEILRVGLEMSEAGTAAQACSAQLLLSSEATSRDGPLLPGFSGAAARTVDPTHRLTKAGTSHPGIVLGEPAAQLVFGGKRREPSAGCRRWRAACCWPWGRTAMTAGSVRHFPTSASSHQSGKGKHTGCGVGIRGLVQAEVGKRFFSPSQPSTVSFHLMPPFVISPNKQSAVIS